MNTAKVIDFLAYRQSIEQNLREIRQADTLAEAIENLIQRLRENEPVSTEA